MFRLIGCLVAIVTAGHVYAAEFHHVHLTATDTKAAAEWYAEHFDGQAVQFGPFDIALIDEMLFVFRKGEEGFGGSEGTAVDHIGFSVANTETKLTELRDAGVKVVGELREIPGSGMHYAFVEDPWGTKIEIIDDPDTPGFHHVHLHTPDAAATAQWYADTFGGEVTKFLGILPAIKYGDMWLIIQPSKDEEAATEGRAIDHIGWSFADLKADVAALQEKGLELTQDITETPMVTYAFTDGPDGVRIELVQQQAAN